MPETTFLHIQQSSDLSSARVLELSEATIRVGRGAQCEVRLREPTLAEVQCLLRRRGESWHVTPVGQSGRLFVEGEPVEVSRPLALDEPLRVGDFWLTLRPAGADSAGMGSFDSPITVDPVEAAPPRKETISRPEVSPPGKPVSDAHRARPEGWKSEKEGAKRWEERWRAAGDSLRSRSASPRPAVSAPSYRSPRPASTPTRPPEAPRPAADSPMRERFESRSRPMPTRGVEARTFVENRPEIVAPTVPIAPASPPTSRLSEARPIDERPDREESRPPTPSEPIDVESVSIALSPSVEPIGGELALRDDPAGVGTTEEKTSGEPSGLLAKAIFEWQPFSSNVWKERSEAYPEIGHAALPGYAAPSPGHTEEIPPSHASTDQEAPSNAAGEASSLLGPVPVGHYRNPIEVGPSVESGDQVAPTPREDESETTPPADAIREEGAASVVSPLQDAILGDEQVVAAREDLPAGSDDDSRLSRVPSVVPDQPSEPISAHRSDMTGGTRDSQEEGGPELPLASPEGSSPKEAKPLDRVRPAEAAPRPAEAEDRPDRPVQKPLEITSVPVSRSRKAHLLPPAETAPPAPRPQESPWHGGSPYVTPTAVVPPSHDSAHPPLFDDHHWPSARSILAASGAASAPRTRQPTRRRPKPATAAKSSSRSDRKPAARPAPMEGQEPATWSLPFWLAWPVACLLTLGIGGAGIYAALLWTKDDQAAGVLADRLLKGGPLPEEVSAEPPPVAAWWGSTAGHLYLHAVAADQAKNDPESPERVRFLLHAARSASPLRPDLRLALARRPRTGADGETPVVGLSYDMASLAWGGHELLAAGQAEKALESYTSALDLAARADIETAVPAFDDEAETRRFRLPGESLLGPIVEDMAAQADWKYSQWSVALPRTALAWLAAYRALRDKEDPEASKALETAVALTEPPSPYPVASHLAAQAEALAFLGRREEAATKYREAIDRQPDGPIRRSWWANLGEILARVGDEKGRDDAWSAAVRGASASDEVGKQVARARERAGLIGSPKETPASATLGSSR